MKYARVSAILVNLALAGAALADDCGKACAANRDACLGRPGANRSTCASDFAACLGSNPASQPSNVEPTCANGSTGGDQCLPRCEDAKNKCLTAPGSNKSTCSSDYESCKGSCSGNPAGNKLIANQCLPQFEDGKNKCFGAPGSNKATCSSDYEACKSTCSGGGNKVLVPVPAGGQCQTCEDAQNKCLAAPGSNKATCSSDYLACCKSSCPDKNVGPNVDGVAPVLIGAGARVTPLMGFMAIAAVAVF